MITSTLAKQKAGTPASEQALRYYTHTMHYHRQTTRPPGKATLGAPRTPLHPLRDPHLLFNVVGLLEQRFLREGDSQLPGWPTGESRRGKKSAVGERTGQGHQQARTKPFFTTCLVFIKPGRHDYSFGSSRALSLRAVRYPTVRRAAHDSRTVFSRGRLTPRPGPPRCSSSGTPPSPKLEAVASSATIGRSSRQDEHDATRDNFHATRGRGEQKNRGGVGGVTTA